MTSYDITTIQDFIDHDAGLSIWCASCGKGGMVDLQRAKLRHGADLNLYAKPLPITCPHCGRTPAFSYHGPGTAGVRGITRG